ncbi:SDR family oxidoreductase [Burkholderia sp. Ax-1724]|nr:SDR family oxidoreductase [Burkholderia sp. Ax-1724]
MADDHEERRRSVLRFENKVAIVSGCGSSLPGWGTGKAIAAVLARQGAQVVGLDVNEEALADTRAVIEGEGGKLKAMLCDVTDPRSIDQVVRQTLDAYGRIDVLVNNVGVSAPGNVVDMSEELWDRQFDINLKSVFLMCKAVLPVMDRQRSGNVVNVSSLSALRYSGKPQIAYSSSKAALIQFTRMAALMHGENNVRLNCVIPGLITTPLVQRLANQFGGGDYEAYLKRRNAQVPLAQEGDAWDVANATAFLASDEARYITATEILVDGGSASTMR